jgi:hypothetical protein
MLDILKDIAAHINPLGIDMVRVKQAGDHVEITGIGPDQFFMLKARTKDKLDDVESDFGIANFGRLNYLLTNPEYRKNSKIEIIKEQRKDGVIPTKIEFSNEDGDFNNVYNFASTQVVKIKVQEFETMMPKWIFNFTPSVKSIDRFKGMAGAFAKEPVFRFILEKEKLIATFGDEKNDHGSFVFHTDVDKKIDTSSFWPTAVFSAILSLDGTKTMALSSEGMIKISVDSGLIEYDFMILAQGK